MKIKFDVDGWHTSMIGAMRERYLYQIIAAGWVVLDGSPDDAPNLKESGDYAYVLRIYDIGANTLSDASELAYAANNEANDYTLVFEELYQTRQAAVQELMRRYCEA